MFSSSVTKIPVLLFALFKILNHFTMSSQTITPSDDLAFGASPNYSEQSSDLLHETMKMDKKSTSNMEKKPNNDFYLYLK